MPEVIRFKAGDALPLTLLDLSTQTPRAIGKRASEELIAQCFDLGAFELSFDEVEFENPKPGEAAKALAMEVHEADVSSTTSVSDAVRVRVSDLVCNPRLYRVGIAKSFTVLGYKAATTAASFIAHVAKAGQRMSVRVETAKDLPLVEGRKQPKRFTFIVRD